MKTFSAFDVMEQNGGDFNREEECKISMLVSSASNQVHVKVFFLSLKDPESLTLFKPFASHVLIFGTTLFLGELKCFDIVFGKPYRCHPKSDFILVRFAEFFTSLEGYLLNTTL